MTTQAMFGKASVAQPAARPRPVSQPASQPARTMEPQENQYAGLDNLNDIDFGRTFAARYAQDRSMLVVFVLWLFFGGVGGHRFYLGHRWIGAAMAALGSFNGILMFTAGITGLQSFMSGNGFSSGGMISTIVVMVIHFLWVFFDFFYILVRKLMSR